MLPWDAVPWVVANDSTHSADALGASISVLLCIKTIVHHAASRPTCCAAWNRARSLTPSLHLPSLMHLPALQLRGRPAALV